jgi:hypothetical protein
MLEYRGKWDDCLKKKPLIGQRILPWPGVVTKVSFARTSGGVGSLSVTITADSETADDNAKEEPSADAKPAPKYELRWVNVEKPLESHPLFEKKLKTATTVNASAGSLSEEEKSKLKPYEGAEMTIGTLIAAAKADGALKGSLLKAGVIGEGHEEFVSFFSKYDAGMESYSLYAPVARRTEVFFLAKTTFEGAGFVEQPSGFPSLPKRRGGEYQWLKTTSDYTWDGENRVGEHVEEWTGADTVDSDIYGSK